MGYNPPFEVSNKIISLVSEISELVAMVTVSSDFDKNPRLRRENRIKTIQGSLAIEQNTLSIEQITAVMNGRAVLAPPKDIEEVKNAFEAYELLDTLDPCSTQDLLKAHGVLMRGLIDGAGEFRIKAAGVVDGKSGKVIHIGTLPDYVPGLVENLLMWLKESNIHALIKGCVFHYEFEVIHPFLDGNGRLGRLWHTLILSEWKPVFAYIPVESMIHKNQREYYDCINRCNVRADSTEFIEFMLSLIKQTLQEIAETTCSAGTSREQVARLLEFCKTPRTRREMQDFIGIDGRKAFNSNFLKPLIEQGRLSMTIPDKPNSKNQKYFTK